MNIEDISSETAVQQVLEELVDPASVASVGTIERAALIFFYLDLVEKHGITSATPVLVTLLRGDDSIIAMEAERVLKNLLPLLEGTMADKVTEELDNFNQRIASAIVNSRLVEIR